MIKLITASIILLGILFGSDSALKEGDPAPDFTLKDQNGKSHRLSDYRGQPVVVYFYPKDDTPGCTKEACGIRDMYKEYEQAGIQVFGISYDDQESHKEFEKKYNLPFTLLSDTAKSVSELYGTKGFLMASRKTFLINKKGVVFKIYDKVDVTSHAEEILSEFE